MTVRHLLPIVMVVEAPPRSGLGPLGEFGLARLDPANYDALCVFTSHDVNATQRRCVERTLGLFKRVAFKPEHVELGGMRGAWAGLAPQLEGRRVVLVGGRVAEAAGFKGLPPLRWLRLGGEGEPAEVCVLPESRRYKGWWRSNEAAVGEWLRQVRRDHEDANEAWVAIGGGWAYHLARDEWGRLYGREVEWVDDGDLARPERDHIRGRLLEAATGIRRGGGFWALTILDHLLLVADLCANPGAKRLALAHDLHETPLVGDASSPLKRIMRSEWRPVERVAQQAVERLLDLDPTPEEREEVRRADRLALLVEARQVGVDLGDPDAEFGGAEAEVARMHASALAAFHATPGNWLRAWAHAESAC